ncbi:cryptochrome/photolyase family protein [Roseovarius sp. C7]|uniref:cryptochrome/photolyase family protein n=1 Tax=Roseovarius sp. C7 TaxID=3398643 RepID=UPI0039F6FBD3
MTEPTLLWLRRDLRLSDHPALLAAVARGGPVIPVVIRDDLLTGLGSAPKWRLGLSLAVMETSLREKASRLILRSGAAAEVLAGLVEETGAEAVYWTRAYDPDSIARDRAVKAHLEEAGIEARSHAGHLLFEPWEVETGQGSYYKVYTPYWNAVKSRDVAMPERAPAKIPAPERWPESDALEDWALGAGMRRGAAVVRPYQQVGEAAAQERLAAFTDAAIDAYKTARDLPGRDGTSGLSENLSLGEISVRQCWHAVMRARHEGAAGAETWAKELVWREFAYHLVYHTPRLVSGNWREEWDGFPWREVGDSPEVVAWKQGRTGVAFVDAAMREMYVTGKMHNRARMVAASYLTKHLMTHWRIGQAWFEEHLSDWDVAANALGWQWVAGSGPDASPFFRIFNPETQAEKFDKDGAYRRAWIAEGQAAPPETARAYFDAVPRRWGLSVSDRYPDSPVVGLKEGRAAALAAYEARKPG